jgi:hypothetical protein
LEDLAWICFRIPEFSLRLAKHGGNPIRNNLTIAMKKAGIVRNADLSHSVERWPRGTKNSIVPAPLDANTRYNGREVVATFHTHPNPPVDETGREWQQGPSEADRRWHRRRKLRGIVVGREFIYEIEANGDVSVLGDRDKVIP